MDNKQIKAEKIKHSHKTKKRQQRVKESILARIASTPQHEDHKAATKTQLLNHGDDDYTFLLLGNDDDDGTPNERSRVEEVDYSSKHG